MGRLVGRSLDRGGDSSVRILHSARQPTASSCSRWLCNGRGERWVSRSKSVAVSRYRCQATPALRSHTWAPNATGQAPRIPNSYSRGILFSRGSLGRRMDRPSRPSQVQSENAPPLGTTKLIGDRLAWPPGSPSAESRAAPVAGQAFPYLRQIGSADAAYRVS